MTITRLIIEILADGLLIPVILLAAYQLIRGIPRGKRYQAYCRVLMAALTAYLLAKYIGSIFTPDIARPFELLKAHAGALYLNDAGFPSDHALFATTLTLAVWFETRHKKITLILALLTILICIGRVLALVHTPLDLLGGIVIAGLGALWYGVKLPWKRESAVE